MRNNLSFGTFIVSPLLTIAITMTAGALPAFSQVPTKPNPPTAPPINLVRNGSSAYVIALALDAIPAERTAANELQNYLKQVTGANIPIKNEGAVGDRVPQILVGTGRRVKRLLPKQNWASIGNDGILIKTQGKNLILTGSRPRGALYAVYQFLEDGVGVRWWTPSESKIPKRPILKIAALNIAYTPPFAYREHYTTAVQNDKEFAARMHENGRHQPLGIAWGGHYDILGWCHTFENLLPIADYFPTHPEWFSDPENGNKPCTASSKMPAVWQLNLTNDEARRELTKKALEWIRVNPEAGMISISQNDNTNYCRSEGDMAIIEREGSPSGPLLHFVNQVAADIHREFPNFLVETLAYQHTRKAPRFEKPAPNVIARLCSIEADFARPLNSEGNKSFRDDLLAWEKISPRLFVWNYITNFARVIWPHPNLNILGPDLRFMAAHHVYGVFEQGDAYSNGVGDFVQLRAWLVAKLMWNPQQDQNKLINEYLAGYYGAAAPHLRSYIDLLQSKFLKTGKPLSTYSGDFAYLNIDTVGKAWAYFAAAQKAVANDPVLSKRVRRERLALDNVILTLHKELSIEAHTKKIKADFLPSDMLAFANEFIATAHANNVASYAEGQEFGVYEKLISRRYQPPAPLPEPLQNQIPASEIQSRVIDLQETEFSYFRAPSISELVIDPFASNKAAARELGNTNDWALQHIIHEEPSRLAAKPWKFYAVVRIEAKPGANLDGPAFTAGMYNESRKQFQFEITKNLRGLEDGQYHLVELGEIQPENGSMIYVAAPKHEDISNIFIDRLLLVRNQ